MAALDYPDAVARRIGLDVLSDLCETRPLVFARRPAKACALTGPVLDRLLERTAHVLEKRTRSRAVRGRTRAPRSGSLGSALRTPIGSSKNIRRWGWRCSGTGRVALVTAPEVMASVERHLNTPREVALSTRRSRCWPLVPSWPVGAQPSRRPKTGL